MIPRRTAEKRKILARRRNPRVRWLNQAPCLHLCRVSRDVGSQGSNMGIRGILEQRIDFNQKGGWENHPRGENFSESVQNVASGIDWTPVDHDLVMKVRACGKA